MIVSTSHKEQRILMKNHSSTSIIFEDNALNARTFKNAVFKKCRANIHIYIYIYPYMYVYIYVILLLVAYPVSLNFETSGAVPKQADVMQVLNVDLCRSINSKL